MVVFICGQCGESLKKNKVEMHYRSRCRNCNVLSCVDCGKDFWGNEYEQHIKCISEEEKYSGKNYVPKPNANKNEIKQQQWFEQVQAAIDKCQANPQLRHVLGRLKDYPNIPRKQKKFMNFLSSSLNCRDERLCNEAWKVLMESMPHRENKEEPNQANETSEASKENGEAGNSNTEETPTNTTTDSQEETTKLSKRERKEERRKKQNKTEKKEKHKENEKHMNGGTNGDTRQSKKHKKRKHLEIEQDDTLDDSRLVEEDVGKEEESESTEPVQKKLKTKFNWAEVITDVLVSKGEMKIKKLKKKVLGEYLAQGCTETSEEKLWAKFDKRLKKVPGVKVVADRVKFVVSLS